MVVENKKEVQIDMDRYIRGIGDPTAEIMIVVDRPSPEDQRSGVCLMGTQGELLKSLGREHNINLNKCYITYAVKYRTRVKNVPQKEVKLWAPYLKEEIDRVNPKFILAMGKVALNTIMYGHPKVSSTEYRGTLVDYPNNPTIKIFPTFSLGHIIAIPGAKNECDSDWRLISILQRKGELTYDKTKVIEITTLDALTDIVDHILSSKEEIILLSVDMEWEGKHWMDPDRYIRTIQFTDTIGWGVVVEFYDAGKVEVIPQIGWEIVKKLLHHPKVRIVGHSVIADGQWLLGQGIDIRTKVVYDTMLAEHTINLSGPFGLEAVTTKYTDLGRYDTDLLDWKRAGGNTDYGYGLVPREILIPYGAADVDTVLRVMKAQMPKLKPFTEPRDEYPSLWDVVMHTQYMLYEIEGTGLKVDKERLADLTELFQAKLSRMQTDLKVMAANLGVEDFNPNSVNQVRHIMFDILKIPPVKTTEGKSWDWVLDQHDDVAEEVNPSTDKITLEILQDAHPFVKLMRNTRKVEHICRTWLRDDFETGLYDETTKGGGIIAKIWPDGRLHARFSQLKETARFSSSKPNIQNWIKRAQGDLVKIFQEG